MKVSKGRKRLIAAAVALTLFCAWAGAALAQGSPGGFPNVLNALKAAPGCLGVETGRTSSGRRVIFAWFESKKALVDWYHSDVHQRAMRSVFPGQVFDRQPLPELADDSGPILTIVSVKFADTPAPEATSPRIAAIGIELYGHPDAHLGVLDRPLPGGVAVGGRFAPEALKVRGLREIELGTAQGQPR